MFSDLQMVTSHLSQSECSCGCGERTGIVQINRSLAFYSDRAPWCWGRVWRYLRGRWSFFLASTDYVTGSEIGRKGEGKSLVRQQQIDRCLDTVWAIASSRYSGHFVIGFTAQSISGRMGGTYYRNSFHHMVVLADRLTRADGLALEEALQIECKRGAARGAPYRRKYHPDHRSDVYRRSVGNAGHLDEFGRFHSVYMAWVEP